MLASLLLLLGWLPGLSAPSRPDTTRQTVPDSLVRVQCPQYARLRVSAVLFVGNAVTKERILRAELDFQEGDTLVADQFARRLEANRRRLYNLQLFHQVLTEVVCRDGELTVLFSLQERWYTFPVPIFSLADRNFRSWLDRPDRWQRVDYGLHVVRRNFRGRNETLAGNLQLGFNRKYELFYEAPGYGRSRRLGAGFGISYYRSHSLDYATVQDRLVAFRDETGFPIERRYLTVGLRWRHTVQRRTAFDVAYHREQISDTIRQLNPNYFLGRTRREYLDFALVTTLNQRNTFAYPLTGRFLQLRLLHRASLSPGIPNNSTASAQYAQYYALGHGFYYNFNLQGQLRLAQRAGYFDNRALGYDYLVRGYDPYVVDGRHYGLVQQSVTYRLFDLGRLKLEGIDNPKINSIPLVLYLNTFVDAGYVAARTVAPTNQLPDHLLRSAGIGLHLVTFYDRVFTLEYTRNGLGRGGFFFRSEFPI